MTHNPTIPTDADLVALVGSRLCHDLISPLGAIGNGVELLTMTGMSGPELQLVEESVAVANAKVKFFRIAFGRTVADQLIANREVISVLTDYARGGRIKYDWNCATDMPRNAVKMALLAILCMEPILSRGGSITISHDRDGWDIRGNGPQIRQMPDAWAALDTPSTNLTPSQVQFALLPREVSAAAGQLSWSTTETGAQIRFKV